MARFGIPLLSVSALTAGVLALAPFDGSSPSAIAPASNPGVVYEIEVTDHSSSPPTTESIEAKVEGKNLKMEIASQGDDGRKGEMIFRGDRREMVVVDHDDEQYMVLDEATIQMLAGQFKSAMSQMQEALKNVPEAQRPAMEKMMKERGPMAAMGGNQEPARLVNTGEKATKNGYPCVKYEVWRGDRKLREMWVTPYDRIEGGDEAAGAFQAMSEFFQAMLDEMGGNAGPLAMGADEFQFMKDMNGFPVVTLELNEDESVSNESNLRSATRRTLDPAEFEPPAGYKRRSMGPS